MYTYRTASGTIANRISRRTERGGRAAEERIIIDSIPGGRIRDGGHLRVGTDGHFYGSTGDAGDASLLRRLDSLAGKMLRLSRFGAPAPGNPFPGAPLVYTLGHRNPGGLAFHPASGVLFTTEHGPTGNDEEAAIVAGRNYGWPSVVGRGGDPRFADRLLLFNPAVAPAGAAIYDAPPLGSWRGSLFVATLRGQHLRRIALDPAQPTRVLGEERLYDGTFGRIRDVAVGPDGALYLATSNRDGRGSPRAGDDRILRIVP